MICKHCGCDIAAKRPGKPRSVPQHRRYFALIRAALHHWPEAHRFQPASAEHLRHWLQAKAGWRTVVTIDTGTMTPAEAVAASVAAMKAGGPFAFVEGRDARLYVITSRSVDFDTLPHLTACAVFDAVAEVIAAETGLAAEQIMPPVGQRRSKIGQARAALLEGLRAL